MSLIPRRKSRPVTITRDPETGPLVTEFRHELDRLFDRFLHGSWFEPWRLDERWVTGDLVPSVDVAEGDELITVAVEVPGLTPEDLTLELSGSTLTIRGEKRESTEDTGGAYYHSERRFGSFTRSIELPSTADLDQIEAEETNGLLTIRVRKLPAAISRKIEIKATEGELASSV
jgi:HSP20 family protein